MGATRESNWEKHLSSVCCMLSWLLAYDHVNYERYLPAYWQLMLNLLITYPDCHQEILSSWKIRHQNSHGSIACDQAVEQTCSRDSKSTGGLTGLLRIGLLFTDGSCCSMNVVVN